MSHGWTSTLMLENAGREVTCGNVADYDGQYTGYATDGIRDSTSTSTRLETLFPALWNGPPDKIYAGKVGDNVTITCEVCQHPVGSFTWTLNGDSLPGDIQESGDTLTIPSVTTEHFGNYTCRVSNTIHSSVYTSTFDLTLIPVGPPDPPTDLVVIAVTSVSVTLQWRCGSDNGVPEMIFNVMKKEASEPDSAYTELEVISVNGCRKGTLVEPYRVENLAENVAYNFRVIASNQYGSRQGNGGYAQIDQQTNGQPNVTIVHLELTESFVNLTWDYLEGEAYILRLYHQSQGARKRRDVACGEGWQFLEPDINGTNPMNRMVYRNDTFDLSTDNAFVLCAFEDATLLNQGFSTGGSAVGEGTVQGIPKPEPPTVLGFVLGLVFGLLLIIVAVGVGYIYFKRRSLAKKDDDQHQLQQSAKSRGNGPQSTAVKSDIGDGSPSGASMMTEAVVYAQVEKTKRAKRTEATGEGVETLYENPSRTGQTHYTPGVSAGDPKHTPTRPLVGSEDVIYAELVWPPKPKGKKDVIHRKEPPTIYATIDFSKKADPLPEEPVEDDDIWGTVPEDMLPPDEED